MSRKKVKLQYIINQSSRKASYNKRKTCLLKKVKEISILCGIEACVIIYGENSVEPEVCPPGPGTLNVVLKFRSVPEFERSKRNMDLEGFLRQSIEKSQEQLRKQILENKKKKFINFIDKALINKHNNTDLMSINELNDLANMNELNDLTKFIDNNIKEIEKKLNSVNVEVEEHVGNGIEAMTGIEQQDNIGNAQVVMNGANMQVDAHGLDTNMGYDIQSDYQSLSWDNPVIPYHDYNMDTDGL
ncbi:agamous-like MADS-box protein AGL80 [Lathyrus oleraceus]|uniref:MADS-box domain-containing protein n=1 Tax=Pisum sativum TaxID=3888 RepID=A0A9D4WSN3_PEA|nr:agamous-like MADS-box protein AGL80 [Pisum sativum]KAI5408374.1 hypothetical protein KIW84_054270 [Pisum sativum]